MSVRRDALRNALYARQAESPTHRAIFREVYGGEYPEEVQPFSYVTQALLARIAQALGVGGTIIDLGCGRGGPGLWVARETGAALVGVDRSIVGATHASGRARDLGLAGRTWFEVADLAALPFADVTFDGAMSIDVFFLLPPNIVPALRDVARVLRPGGRLVFTDWARDLSPPAYPPPISDHRPLLREAGFEAETYEEVPGAEAKRRAIYEQYLARREALARELGEEAIQLLMFEARNSLGLEDGVDYLAHSQCILAVAFKTSLQ